jgi:hypothetical protein
MDRHLSPGFDGKADGIRTGAVLAEHGNILENNFKMENSSSFSRTLRIDGWREPRKAGIMTRTSIQTDWSACVRSRDKRRHSKR